MFADNGKVNTAWKLIHVEMNIKVNWYKVPRSDSCFGAVTHAVVLRLSSRMVRTGILLNGLKT